MSRSRTSMKGRALRGTFTALPHDVLASAAVASLSAYAKALLLDLCGLYRIGRNGDIGPSRSVMRARGWYSHDTLTKTIKELESAGLIERTRQGGLHACSLFAFSWIPIDSCGGRLDVAPTSVASGLWRKFPPKPRKKRPARTAGKKAHDTGPFGPSDGRNVYPLSPRTGPKTAQSRG